MTVAEKRADTKMSHDKTFEEPIALTTSFLPFIVHMPSEASINDQRGVCL